MVNDILAIKLLNEEPIIGDPIIHRVSSLDSVKQVSYDLLKT